MCPYTPAMTRTRLKSKATQPAVRPVETRKQSVRVLVPAVRIEALRLAQGDATRVEVVSPTEAIVR